MRGLAEYVPKELCRAGPNGTPETFFHIGAAFALQNRNGPCTCALGCRSPGVIPKSLYSDRHFAAQPDASDRGRGLVLGFRGFWQAFSKRNLHFPFAHRTRLQKYDSCRLIAISGCMFTFQTEITMNVITLSQRTPVRSEPRLGWRRCIAFRRRVFQRPSGTGAYPPLAASNSMSMTRSIRHIWSCCPLKEKVIGSVRLLPTTRANDAQRYFSLNLLTGLRGAPRSPYPGKLSILRLTPSLRWDVAENGLNRRDIHAVLPP